MLYLRLNGDNRIMVSGCCGGYGYGGGGDDGGSGGVGCCIVSMAVAVVLVVIYRQITIIIKYVYLRRPPILCNI